MDLELKYTEIKQFLSISDDNFDLLDLMNDNYQSDEVKGAILGKILSFIYNFAMFKQNREFMLSVYKCIQKTVEIKLIATDDFDELIVKNALMRFIQEYIEYAKIGQKEQVLNFLADSFERLGLQPLIINLGLMLKPMYSDQKYIDNINKLEETEVVYALNEELELEIKREVDQWLESQDLGLNRQDELKEQLQEEFNGLISKYNLSKGSTTYNRLLLDVIEMLSMKLTMISLMDSIEDDSLEPVPIK